MSDILRMGLSVAEWPGTQDEAADLLLYPAGLSEVGQTPAKVAAIAALAGLADITTMRIPEAQGGVNLGIGAVELAGTWLDLPTPIPPEFVAAAERLGKVLVTLSAHPLPAWNEREVDNLYRRALMPPTPGRLWVGSLAVTKTGRMQA